MANLLASLILAFWMSAIALISVQNATPVTVRFLQLQTVSIPVGVVLGFCGAIGAVGMAAILPFWRSPSSRSFDD